MSGARGRFGGSRPACQALGVALEGADMHVTRLHSWHHSSSSAAVCTRTPLACIAASLPAADGVLQTSCACVPAPRPVLGRM